MQKKFAKADEAMALRSGAKGCTRRLDLVVTESAPARKRARKERSWTVPIAVLAPDSLQPSKQSFSDAQNTILHTLEQFLAAARIHSDEPDERSAAHVSGDTMSALDFDVANLSPDCRLTPRETQVLEHVLAGRSNKETAELLMISRRTVEHHRAAVMQKTRARSVPELIRIVAGVGTARS
jgi:DNA-binding CsgD family transcriptional regulator